MSGLTLGHFLYVMAAIEIVVVPLMALRMMRANPDAPAAGAYVMIGAAIVTAIALCAVATFSEAGRIEIGAAASAVVRA
ncbi:MAG: hypothetical protein QOG13_545 [Sphingomonadales bacterium]|jgi:hypothetical protein|nr:hypothetical protein [Sphingomonadales bacterium]